MPLPPSGPPGCSTQDASVLALDEATANVDRDTDALIQAALRAATAAGGSGPSAGSSGGVGDGGSSSGCRSRSGGSFRWRDGGRRRTLLVIAHRIDTIIVSAAALLSGY